MKYIFELNPAEIEFKNFEIKVFKDEKEYFKTNDSFNLKLIRENSEYKWLMSDSRFNIKTIHAEGKISKLENEIFSKGRFELKKFKINNMVGFFNELTNLNPESGELEGILDFLNSPNETKLDGNINILNFRGEIFQFSNIGSKEFHLNSKFSYFKEITGKKIESHFKKTLSNPDFVLDELETISESNLKNISINFKIDDFKKLTSKLNLEDKFNVSGKLNLKLEFQETGKQSDYFLVNGLGEMKNFELVSVSPLIDIKKTDLKFFWNNQNLNASLTGKLFGEDVLFNLNSELKFQKELESKKIFISSNSDLEMKLDKLYIENFYSIFESIYTYIYDDIKERQEKMLPESYLVLDPFYKFYFEHAKLFFKIDFPSISKKTNEIDYGKFAFNSKMENGILSFNFTDLGKEKSLDLKSTIYIDRKIPTIDFRLNSDNLFLSHKLFDFCDVSFFADFLNFDFTFISSGNNFSDFYANKSIAGFFEANSGVFIKNGKYSDKVSIMENLKSNEVGSLKFNFNGYSQDLFINSLNLISKDFLINGNSSTQKGEQGYNFSGQIKNSQFGLSFYKKGDLCYKKK